MRKKNATKKTTTCRRRTTWTAEMRDIMSRAAKRANALRKQGRRKEASETLSRAMRRVWKLRK